MLKNAYGFSVKDKYEAFTLPRYLTFGLARKVKEYTISFDSEYIFGKFSGLKEKNVEIWFLRAGLEKELTSWLMGRAGLVYPAIAKTSTLGNIKDDLPWPKIGGALGFGVKYHGYNLDVSIYGDAAKSYVEQKPTISEVVTITAAF